MGARPRWHSRSVALSSPLNIRLRPDHRDRQRQRVGVDHGCDRIGGVVESVDEFEAEGDEQRHAEQEERQIAGDGRTGRSQILMDAVSRKKKAREP